MGQKVVLSDIAFTDLTLPKLYPDPIMSDGSLLLLDVSNPAGYDLGISLPVAGNLIPNIAWQQAAAILGSGTRTTLSPIWMQTFTGTSSSKHKVEFTAKKGLHGIISKSPGISSGEHMGFSGVGSIQAYIATNFPTRNFYVSLWFRPTRAQTAGTAPQAFHYVATNTATFAWYSDPIGPGAGGGSGSERRTPSANSLANSFINFAPTPKALASAVSMSSWLWGSKDAWSGFNTTQCRSDICYKVYIEDLTTSGRTYAQVDAIDYALWQAAFAVGGRFYNDTFTDPTTIP